MQVPGGVALPFAWVHVRGDRVTIGPQNSGGSLAGPFGKVGAEVTPEQAYERARRVGLSILGSPRHEMPDLDCIAGWLRVFGHGQRRGFDRHPR